MRNRLDNILEERFGKPIGDYAGEPLVGVRDEREESINVSEVIEECNDFPSGTNDDLVDSTTQALLRFRQGGFITLDTDEKEDRIFTRRRAAYY